MQRILLFFISTVIVLGVAASASAQGPSRDAYGGQGDVASEVADKPGGGVAGVNAGTGSPTDAVARPLRGDELPFTGLDVGLVAMGGMLLLALGFGVRRASREPASRPT